MMKIEGDKKQQEQLKKYVLEMLKDISPDVEERKIAYTKRRDMFEGRHHKYSNVVGQTNKEREGHILPVFNYIRKFCTKLYQSLTNYPFRFKIVGDDESNEIEVSRAEAVEEWIRKVLHDNQFFPVIFKRGAMEQIRDGDYAINCVVEENENGEREIKIYLCEDMSKLYVLWDDAAGSSFSAITYVDEWSKNKIEREFPDIKELYPNLSYYQEKEFESSTSDHSGNEYGTLTSSITGSNTSPSGKTKILKNLVTSSWCYVRVLDAEGNKVWKIANIILIGKGSDSVIAQLAYTDYKDIPWKIGHSTPNPGKPWSTGFIDDLTDANIELNDRSGEEGDMIRIGANRKFVVYNMPDFDATSLKPGSGQAIFIEGENADFKPLADSVNTFPSESYKNSMQEHLFSLGIPKIGLAAGSAPYTGRVGAIQYQAITDVVTDFRSSWDSVNSWLFEKIQEYTIQFFPDEMKEMFKLSFEVGEGMYEDGEPSVRNVEFDWENPLPLSRSDAIVDASTLYDRSALPLRMLIEAAGFKDGQRIIKELKKEWKDPDLVTLRQAFQSLSTGVQVATAEARRSELNSQEMMDASASSMGGGQGTPVANKPIMQNFQNQGERRGISSSKGAPQTGQVSQEGASRQVQQNLNAKG